jgi:hypothetical protein
MAKKKKQTTATRLVTVVKAQCISCKAVSEMREDQMPNTPAWHPMCKTCFMPLVAISAKSIRVPVEAHALRRERATVKR